ncbi:MAG TPA: hypothetical protein PK272_07880, partial [Methanoregulaceae archaeon]|nr:hypothetical protein [Methanoregulaceae archaeon]
HSGSRKGAVTLQEQQSETGDRIRIIPAAIPIQYPPKSARATRNSVVCTEPTVGRPAAGGGDMPPSRPWANYIRRPS